MRFLRWLCVLLLASVPATAFAADIQVICEPGLRVFLDGTLAGMSSAKDDGFFLANVPEGPHIIRVEKEGFKAQTFRVEVRQLPVEVEVTTFSPEPAVRPDTATGDAKRAQPVGNLQVMSAPQNCDVVIDGKPQPKTTPTILIEGLAAGEHTISFAKPGYQEISGVVTIQAGSEVSVRGDLIAGKVEDVFEGMGSIRVLSTPEYCTVHLLGKRYDKTGQKLNVTHLPAGEHRIVVDWKRNVLSSTVKIFKGLRTVIVVSFMKNDQPFVFSYEPE